MMPAFTPDTVSMYLDMGFTMNMCANDGLALVKGLRTNLSDGYEKMKEWKEKYSKGKQ